MTCFVPSGMLNPAQSLNYDLCFLKNIFLQLDVTLCFVVGVLF